MGLLTITLIAAIVTGLAIKLVMYIMRKSKSVNPFVVDSRTPLKPLVVEKLERQAVLKQCFSVDKVPEELDAIVIGSGIGGLAAAAILAKAGKKVLVLEKHTKAGGCCHVFTDKGYEFDVGIHYIGEMTFQSLTKTLCDQITNGQLIWADLADDFDEVVFMDDGVTALRKYPVTKNTWQKDLKKKFPDEETAIDNFFAALESIKKKSQLTILVKFLPLWLVKILDLTGLINLMTNSFTWNKRTAKEVVFELTENKDLRDIMCYNFGDFGTTPGKAGFPMQAILHNHFMKGASYPVGGASQIPFSVIPVIESSGGKVLTKAEVTDILTSTDGKVTGVRVQYAGSKWVDLKAPIVISDAGLLNTFRHMLPPNLAQNSRLYPLVKKAGDGAASLSVFVGLNCDAEELQIPDRKNLWVFSGGNDVDTMYHKFMNQSLEEALEGDIPLLFLSFPSTKDPQWRKRYPGKTTMALVSFMPYVWVSEWHHKTYKKRGDDYEMAKRILADKLLEKVYKMFPSVQSHVDYVGVGTPLSNSHYLGSPSGEVYGLDHDQSRFTALSSALLRPTTDIPGLYLTGQDVCSCGFVGALYGGVLCAASVLERNVFNDLVGLHNKMKHKKE